MSLDTIRVSSKAKDRMVRLKRHTGIKGWNVLCRWAFALSLAEPNPPRQDTIRTDSSVEMTWRTFGGENDGVYLALLKERCKQDGFELTPESLTNQFRLHLHRGISYLAGDLDVKSIEGLIQKAIGARG